MPVVRPLKPGELAEARRIAAVSYLNPRDAGPAWSETLYEDCRCLRGAFEGERLIALHRLEKREMMLDGRPLAFGAMSAFAALPEGQGHGECAELIVQTLREMRRRELALAWVFPHSYEMYRRFGFELGGQLAATGRMPLSHILVEAHPSASGVWRMSPEDDRAPLRACYRRFVADKNLALVRGDADWERFFAPEAFAQDVRVYAVRDGRGTVAGYMRVIVGDAERPARGGAKTARVTEWVYDHREAMTALLAQLKALEGECELFVLPANPGMPVAAFVATPHNAYMRLEPTGVGRLVDVPRALLAMRAPAGADSAVIATADVILPENNGPFAVSWEGGRVTSVERASRTPDLFVPLSRLMQLIVGFISMREATLLPGVTMPEPRPGLMELFVRRDGLLLDEF